ncbi:MAG: glycosyltransferase family 2 protein [Campylobacteraceae bacterium]|nr:glycosyltransferase family 2 protein [Campylobacteraceae bacterium]
MFNKHVSIIIRTKDSSIIIAQTLKALFSQTFRHFDLIIVDSGSKDDTLVKCSKYKHTLIKIKAQDYHPGKVINYVLEQCDTDVIVFLNSDCVMLLTNTLQLLLDALELENIHAVFARQICRPEATSCVRRDYEVSFPMGEKPEWMHFSLPLAAIKKEVWREVPFYTQSWASEDTKWAIDIKKKGYHVQYVKDALVMHSHNYNFKQLFNRKYVEGEADVYIFNIELNIFTVIKNYGTSVYHDFVFHLKYFDVLGFFKSLIFRLVYHYAYYRGHQNGLKRKKSNDKEVTFGNYQ